MLTARQVDAVRERAVAVLERAGIAITPVERAQVEVADFGLGDLESI